MVLLGHTLDDQAETVLLGLARGSGARALAGMPARRGRFRRPLLGLSRATLREACLAQRLDPWDDPHNSDPSYARVRVRHQALPALEAALGPGIAEALARSASQLSADCEALDAIARGEAWRIQAAAPRAPPRRPAAAARRGRRRPRSCPLRILRGWPRWPRPSGPGSCARRPCWPGCPGGSLTAAHIAALDALVTGWHGQRGADLPGAVRVRRRYGKLLFSGGKRSGRRRQASQGGAAGMDRGGGYRWTRMT